MPAESGDSAIEGRVVITKDPCAASWDFSGPSLDNHADAYRRWRSRLHVTDHATARGILRGLRHEAEAHRIIRNSRSRTVRLRWF